MRYLSAILCSGFALAAASAASAASSDYLLEIDGVKGEAAVESWSFGVCNQGQCSASTKRTIVSPREASSGMATGKTKPKPRPSNASWDLATMKGARTAAIAETGDLDGDGSPDLAAVATQDAVSGLTLTFQKIEAEWRSVCQGKHIAHATLRSAAGDFEITDAMVECTSSSNGAIGGITGGVVAGKQTQGATFGEKVQSGMSSAGSAVASGAMTMTFTGGQMKHTKTGHVTLLK